MKKKDLNEIAQLEKAISKKYGKEAIVNPKSKWDLKKEEKFSKQVKKFYNKIYKNNKIQKSPADSSASSCSACGKEFYFMKLIDEVTYYKHGVCFNCYVEHMQGR